MSELSFEWDSKKAASNLSKHGGCIRGGDDGLSRRSSARDS